LAENKLILEDLPNRLKSRKELFEIARKYTLRITDTCCPNDIPDNIIASGHQANWHHCGIWAKNVTMCKLAKILNGRSLHLVLDHDICDTAIVLPKQGKHGSWYFERVNIESQQKAIPLEFRQLLPKTCIEDFSHAVINTQAGHIFGDIWPRYEVLKSNKISHLYNVADLITYFQSKLNLSLGLNIDYLPVSALSESNAFTNFVISVMMDAGYFTGIYNDAITEQFRERNICLLYTSPSPRD